MAKNWNYNIQFIEERFSQTRFFRDSISNLFCHHTFVRFYSHASTELKPLFSEIILHIFQTAVGNGSRFQMLFCISAYQSSFMCLWNYNITTTNTIHTMDISLYTFSVCSSSLTEYRIQTNWFTPQSTRETHTHTHTDTFLFNRI